MEFHSMKRKELQALCKKHNIPANLSNSQMALSLSSLLQEKEKPTKHGRPSLKVSIEAVAQKDSSITTRQSKKVRFSPTNETFEYLELRSGRKEKKTKVTESKSSLKPVATKGLNPVEKVDNNLTKEVTGKMVRSTRSRVQTTVEGSIIPEINPPAGIKRGRRVGKVADNADSTEENVIKPVRVTRSRGQTSSEGGSVPVPEQMVGKKRGRGRPVKNVDGVEPVEDVVSIPVRTTRSRAQTSKEGGVSTVPNLLLEKKRARKRSKVGDETTQSTVKVLDSFDSVVSQKATSDQAEDLPPKRSLRKRELGNADTKGSAKMRQKSQNHKTSKGISKVFEDEALAKDGGVKEPDLYVRRSTRNVVPVIDTKISKRNFDETEMVGRGKITRSRNQAEQRKTEVLSQAESLRCTGRNNNRLKSVMPQKSGNVVELPGFSAVGPLREKSERRPARKGCNRNSFMPKTDEVKAAEPRGEKGDILKENKIIVPHTGPLRRSRRQTLLLEPIAPTDEELASPVVGGREKSGKQSHAFSSGNKQRGDLNIDEPVVDLQDTHSAEESSRHFTHSATRKNVGNPLTSSLEKRSEQSTHSSMQEGFKEVFAKPLEQAKGQTSVSKSKKFQTDGAKKEEDISVRKRIGDHLFNEDCLEISPKRLTRSSGKSEEITEWNLPKNSGGQKMSQSRSRPPKSVQDGDSKGKETPGIYAKFAMPEVLGSPTDLFSGRTGVVKLRISERSTKPSRSTRSLKKGQLSSSISRKIQTGNRQILKGISGRKERREITFEAVDVGIKRTPPAEEISRRLTRSAFKCNSNATTNLTEKSFDKKKLEKRSKTPMQDVKTPLSDKSSVICGVENSNDAQFSLPEAVKSASGPANVTRGEDQASNLEETPASESERFQTDDRETENVVSIIEAAIITETDIAIGDGPTHAKDVKTPLSDKISVIRGVENSNDAQFSLPEAVKSASGPANITRGEDQASNLEETPVSESERFQTDDRETENVVSINEAVIITETDIAIGDGPTHAKDGMATSTAFSNLGLPNLEKEIALEEGTSTYSIDIMPEVLASASERSIEIEHTSSQETVRLFTGSAGMSESESKDFEIEVPIEEGILALEGAINITANAETSTLDERKRRDQKETEIDLSVDETVDVAETVNIVLDDDKEKSRQCSDEMFNEDGFDGTTSTAIGCLSVKQSHSLGKAQEMHESSTYAQPSPAESDVLVRDNGVNSLDDQISVDCNRLSTETDGNTFVEDDLHAFNQNKGSRENEGISQDGGIADVDGNNLLQERNHDVEETENNTEFVKPHQFSPSPARQSTELESSMSSFAIEELPLQIPGVIESNNTPSRSNKEPLESFDGTLGVFATASFSEKQKSSVKVFTGPASNENVDLVAMNLEKAHDLNLPKLQSERKMVELDLSLEENSVDHNHNSDYAKIEKSPICSAVISETVGSDDPGFENKKESSAAKDDYTSCDDEQKFVELSVLNDDALGKGDENSLNSVGEIFGSFSFNQEKNRGAILDMNDYDGKDSDMGANVEDAVTGSACRANTTIDKNISHSLPTHDNSESGMASKKVVGHRFELQESHDTVPAEESQHEERASKENQHEVTCEAMTDGIHSESDQDYQLQKIFETPVSKNVHESNYTVQQEESQHEVFHCKDNQLQSEEDYERQKFFETPASKSEDRVPEGRCQTENGISTEDQMQSELGEGNAQLSSREDIDDENIWHEDTLPTLFATPTSSNINSQNARSYSHEKMADIAFSDCKTQEIRSVESSSKCIESNLENEMASKCDAFTTLSVSNFDGEKQDMNVWGVSHNVDAGRSDVKDLSDELLFSNKAIIEEDHCDNNTRRQTSHEHLFGTDAFTPEHVAETNWPSCNLMDANHTGEDIQHETEREFSSSVSADEQPSGEPEDHMIHISLGTPDRTIYEDEEPFEGFNVTGAEQYFNSEQTENADYDNFGGNTRELFTESEKMSGHDYITFDEPVVKDEVNNIEAKINAGVEDDKPVAGWNSEEKEKGKEIMQLESSDKITRTEAPSDMSSRTEPSSVSDDFATDVGK